MLHCSRKLLKLCAASIIVHCNIRRISMADETQVKADSAEAAATVAETVKTAPRTVAAAPAKAARRARKTAASRKTAAKTNTKARRKSAKPRKSSTVKPQTAAGATNERTSTMNFTGFNAFPTATPFQSLFGDASERGQEAIARSQKTAGDLAELTRDNVEALAEAGRIAAEGARSLGQELVASTREGVEQAADAVRTLAEAKSPTEFMQIQSELARASFDRMVAETSRLTESAVKLAGEAFQPLSNRASVATDRLNSIVA
jgi:phasin family protein